MNKNNNLSYNLLTKYRTQLMGIAMLWIIFSHIKLSGLPIVLAKVKAIGYGGVDIFFFLSGIGLYLSLIKDDDYKHFYKKRLLRILPKYLIIVLIFSLILLFRGSIGIKVILLNFTSLSFWLNVPSNKGAFNWYIPALIFFYLITPIYFKLFKDSEIKEKFTFISVIVSLFLCILVKTNFLIMLTRLPIFIIGILFGYYIKNEKSITVSNIKFYIISMFIGFTVLFYFIKYFPKYLWSLGLWWYPFIIITPALCIFLAYLLQYIECKMKFVIKFLSFFGKNSLEIYLCHVSFILLFNNTWMNLYNFKNHLYIYNIICTIITVIAAIILREMLKVITIKKK